MKPRRAQEKHSHAGIGSVGAGQRGFQAVYSSGDDLWGAGAGSANLIESNVTTPVSGSYPDLTSGSALYALTRASDVDTFSGATIRSTLGTAGSAPTTPLWLQGDVRLRWRFGAGSDGGASVPWTAAIRAVSRDISSSWSGSAAGTATSNPNILRAEWQYARQLYQVSGGALQLKGTQPTPGFGGSLGGSAAAPYHRFVGVGPGAYSDQLFMVFKCSNASHVANDVAVDLGLEYKSGDLVTWDVTYLNGATHATMKVWHQRLITDTPSSVDFTVPAGWLPWTAADALDSGTFSLTHPSLCHFYKPSTGTYRTVPVSLNVSMTSSSPYQITVSANWPSPEAGESGPYSAFQVFPRHTVYAGTTGTLTRNGSVSGSYTGAAITPMPQGLTVVGCSSITSTNPSLALGTQSDYPAGSLVFPHSMPANIPDISMYQMRQNADPIYWAGLVMPRPSDSYWS